MTFLHSRVQNSCQRPRRRWQSAKWVRAAERRASDAMKRSDDAADARLPARRSNDERVAVFHGGRSMVLRRRSSDDARPSTSNGVPRQQRRRPPEVVVVLPTSSTPVVLPLRLCPPASSHESLIGRQCKSSRRLLHPNL